MPCSPQAYFRFRDNGREGDGQRGSACTAVFHVAARCWASQPVTATAPPPPCSTGCVVLVCSDGVRWCVCCGYVRCVVTMPKLQNAFLRHCDVGGGGGLRVCHVGEGYWFAM